MGRKRRHGHRNTDLNPRLCEKTGWGDYKYENCCNSLNANYLSLDAEVFPDGIAIYMGNA